MHKSALKTEYYINLISQSVSSVRPKSNLHQELCDKNYINNNFNKNVLDKPILYSLYIGPPINNIALVQAIILNNHSC